MAGEVDYDAIERALTEAREQFPQATALRPLWYECRPLVEVYFGRRGQVWTPESAR